MDADLLTRAQAGDRAALEFVLNEVRPLVMRRCARVLPHPQDAEEAAQDSLMTVATKLSMFSGRGSFEGWVGVIATNQARMTYRSMKRRFAEQHSEALAERPDPARTSVIAGSRIDLLDALEALDDRHPESVEAFTLRDLSGLSYEEIAVHIGAPLGTVKARIHTARTFLRERLGETF